MATRLGVDVGGTFTDLIFYDDESGEIHVGKEPTTPSAPEEGVLAAIAASVPAGRLSVARYFLHGTTVGLNSLLTRTGAVVGLLCDTRLPRRPRDAPRRPRRSRTTSSGTSRRRSSRDDCACR